MCAGVAVGLVCRPAALVSPENLLELQILRPHPRPVKSGPLGVGGDPAICLTSTAGDCNQPHIWEWSCNSTGLKLNGNIYPLKMVALHDFQNCIKAFKWNLYLKIAFSLQMRCEDCTENCHIYLYLISSTINIFHLSQWMIQYRQYY